MIYLTEKGSFINICFLLLQKKCIEYILDDFDSTGRVSSKIF
jgi:hypothetical protein